MEISRIIDLFLFAIPSLITGGIAYYFFKEHTKNEDGRRRFLVEERYASKRDAFTPSSL